MTSNSGQVKTVDAYVRSLISRTNRAVTTELNVDLGPWPKGQPFAGFTVLLLRHIALVYCNRVGYRLHNITQNISLDAFLLLIPINRTPQLTRIMITTGLFSLKQSCMGLPPTLAFYEQRTNLQADVLMSVYFP